MNNTDDYIKILINEHSNFINDIVNTFFNNKLIEQIFIYFRIFFFYYLITTYVYKPELNIYEIKEVFFIWIEKTLENKNKKYIIKNFNFHYYYLFKVFFVDKNIYFHVYFNNLLKYFLPLPFELNIYSPLIVYRNNVDTFYKKNNIDYLDTINDFDKKKIHNKNIYNEVDIHIPIKLFNENLFISNDIIYLIGTKEELYITDVNKNIIYSRINDFNEKIDEYLKDFNEGVVFEELFPIWQKGNGKINFNKAFYICVMKKITTNNLFKVFQPYNLNINNYNYLFHNSIIKKEDKDNEENKENNNNIITSGTFFYIIPSSKSRYFEKEEKRKCIIFKIKKDINNLLDLTSSIVTNNNFTKNIITKDKNNKVWISYDPLKVLDYYNKGNISTKYDDNFRCLTTYTKNLNNRLYCDAYNYSGRSKLQEILFKTRKYKYKSIYISKLKKDISYYDIYKLYHPLNIPVNITWDFDKFILKELNINGFFYVDFGDAVDGGEILLINPNKYLEIYEKIEKNCYEK